MDGYQISFSQAGQTHQNLEELLRGLGTQITKLGADATTLLADTNWKGARKTEFTNKFNGYQEAVAALYNNGVEHLQALEAMIATYARGENQQGAVGSSLAAISPEQLATPAAAGDSDYVIVDFPSLEEAVSTFTATEGQIGTAAESVSGVISQLEAAIQSDASSRFSGKLATLQTNIDTAKEALDAQIKDLQGKIEEHRSEEKQAEAIADNVSSFNMK